MATMVNRRKAGSAVAIIILVAALLCGFASPGIRGGIANALDGGDDPRTTAGVVYHNDLAQIDEDPHNNYNFTGDNSKGQNPFEEAVAAVEAGEVGSVQEWVFRINPDTGRAEGELPRRTNPHDGAEYDPALLAALCVDAESRTGVVILTDEQGELIGRRADVAHLHFLQDRDYACVCYDKLENLWIHAGAVHVEVLNGYTSSMYMVPDGLEGDKPSVTVYDSTNTGGHAIIFDLGDKPGQLRYRIECGFQPIDVEEYWPTPDTPPHPDYPEPPTPPEPEPYLEPKDPDLGYQHRNPDNPDVGGGPNHDSDTTQTTDPDPEHTSPDVYTPPAPPTDDKPSGSDGGSSSSHSDASTGTHSGSQTVDQTHGTTETYTDPDTGKQESGTVQAGDGRDHGDMAQHVEEHPATVEPGANPDDNSGNGECGPME